MALREGILGLLASRLHQSEQELCTGVVVVIAAAVVRGGMTNAAAAAGVGVGVGVEVGVDGH